MLITLTPSAVGTGCETDLAIIAGETVARAITLATTSGPINLTGYGLKMLIAFPIPLLLTTDNGGITFTNASTGQAQLNIASETSSEFPFDGFPYDLWMVSGGGFETPLLAGLFIVNQNISPVP